MKYAIYSDIHGNLHALEVVIEHIKSESPDRIICLGDLVGYGAFPNEVTELVMENADVVLAGNHDHVAVGLLNSMVFNQFAHAAAKWTTDNLTSENRKWLYNLPLSHYENGLLFVHSSPDNPAGWRYIFSDNDAADVMKYASAGIAFIGHTHLPKDHQTPHGRLINVGSVGQPRDADPRAAYTIYNGETGERKLVRLEYDVKSASKAILDADLPGFLADRLEVGR